MDCCIKNRLGDDLDLPYSLFHVSDVKERKLSHCEKVKFDKIVVVEKKGVPHQPCSVNGVEAVIELIP